MNSLLKFLFFCSIIIASSSCSLLGLSNRPAAIGEMEKLPDYKAVYLIRERDYTIANCSSKIELSSVGIKDDVGSYRYYSFGSEKNRDIIFLSLIYDLQKPIDKNLHKIITVRSKLPKSCTVSIGSIIQGYLPQNLFSGLLPKKCDGSLESHQSKSCDKMILEAEENIDRFVGLFETISNQKLVKTNNGTVFEYDPDEDSLLKEFYEKTGVKFSRGHYDFNEKVQQNLKSYLNMTGINVVDKTLND